MNIFLKYLTFVLVGFIIVLTISLCLGTREFNYYCHAIQKGNPQGIFFTGKGSGDGGFFGCEINTLSLDYKVLLLGSGIVAFVAQSVARESIRKRLLLALALSIFLTLAFLASFLSFPSVNHGFLEGGTWLSKNHGGFGLQSIFSPYVLLTYIYYLYCQSGPFVFGLLSKSADKYSRSLWRVLGSLAFQVLITLLLFFSATFLNMLITWAYPRPTVEIRPYPTGPLIEITLPPGQINLTE